MTESDIEILNPAQKEAVFFTPDENLLILAGAGSGKTRVITTKIAKLIESDSIAPSEILALTFTKKAAIQMRERATALCPQASFSKVSTFHSFGAMFLRIWRGSGGDTDIVNLSPHFTVYDEDEGAVLLAEALRGEGATKSDKKLFKHFVNLISLCKDNGLTVDDDLSQIVGTRNEEELRMAFVEYERALRKTGNVDFGDLIILPNLILQRDDAFRERMIGRFKIILVDEYQDVNKAQVELLATLATVSGAKLCVVGDDDQSIYKFRGSDVASILGFQEAFPPCQKITLEINYRSTAGILNLANAVIKNNQARLGKNLRAGRTDRYGVSTDKPTVEVFTDEKSEATYCVDCIAHQVEQGTYSYRDFAIIYRMNSQSMSFEQALLAAHIPYRIEGAVKFYEREEVKNALSYLRYICNSDDTVSFLRIANVPTRGLGKTSLERIIDSGFDVARANLTAKAKKAYEDFSDTIESLRKKLSEYENEEPAPNLSQYIFDVLKITKLLDHYKAIDSAEGSERTANLDQLVNTAVKYNANQEGLSLWLEDVALATPAPQNEVTGDEVTLITCHATKGLEFPIVFLTGLEQGIFPLYKNGKCDTEEERRLFYVAVTRAMNCLTLTFCKTRLIYGNRQFSLISQFLQESQEQLSLGEGLEARTATHPAQLLLSSMGWHPHNRPR